MSGVGPLVKGMSILGLFDARNRVWRLKDLVDAVGLPRMTAYRLIRTLVSIHFLVRDHVAGGYRLGPAPLAWVYLADEFSDLVNMSRDYLDGLSRTTGEHVTLAVEIGGAVVNLVEAGTVRPFQPDLAVGRIIDDLANASGKVFAAFKVGEERTAILSRRHTQLTPYTITDPTALSSELDRVADEGVAFDVQERRLGACAVAAPIRDSSFRVVAAVCLVVPPGRFGPSEMTAHAREVRSCARSISACLAKAAANVNTLSLLDGD